RAINSDTGDRRALCVREIGAPFPAAAPPPPPAAPASTAGAPAPCYRRKMRHSERQVAVGSEDEVTVRVGRPDNLVVGRHICEYGGIDIACGGGRHRKRGEGGTRGRDGGGFRNE